ncbi:pyroglutamyl-peptidase I [Opisthorchis viverrini]|uniref:Uncharacterized protein n=2 Tax=Opisthorchis viverrini TaxID=6198 RepID=A0A074ZJC9_OPIVI|nr:hypothetical protein T265_06739 [Opisthorchis viverrini]KER25882.1 hypothetical protein T265_06739 [Opisthorchis viverrini]OON14781.1 pyroglutamyl-peptidase I [Opisthorchis viverrini]
MGTSTKPSKAYRIVITGFGAFGIHEENSSSVAVQTLRELWFNTDELHSCSVELITFENVPVTYRDCLDISNRIWDSNPDLVIHVGLDSSARAVTLESQAFNGPYNMPDVDGDTCKFDGLCYPSGLQRLCCKLDLFHSYNALTEKGVPMCLSNNPGLFLCGYIYYLSLSHNTSRTVFIHVPPISELFTPLGLAQALFSIIQDLAAQLLIPIPAVSLYQPSDSGAEQSIPS